MPEPVNLDQVFAGMNAPSVRYAAVTRSDTANIQLGGADRPCRSLYIGTGGNLVVQDEVGTQVTFLNVPGGVILPIIARRVMLTGTTATDIIALF